MSARYGDLLREFNIEFVLQSGDFVQELLLDLLKWVGHGRRSF
jgi:hypothetical protein